MRCSTMVVAGLALVAGALWGGDDPFCGKWKLNMDKSEATGLRADIKDLGNNKYEFKFGDDVQTIVADGKQHSSKWGGTWALKQDSADKWTETHEHEGKVSSTSTWILSDGGNELTIDTKGNRADGSSYTESASFKRAGSGSGIAGTWESTKMQWAATDWEIKPWGNDGLSFVTPAENEHLDLKFDGTDYPDHGPRVAPGSTTAGKRVDSNTIETTDKLKGKVMGKSEMKVSEGGKLLTVTYHPAGVDKPMIFVYDQQ